MSSASTDSRVQLGCTFFIPSGPSGDHLFIVVLDKRTINGKPHLLLASMCTRRNLPTDDTTCIVEAGEHSFAVSQSFIKYNDCRSEPVDHVVSMLDKGTFKVREELVSQELLSRIQKGLHSKKVKRHIKDDWDLNDATS